MRVWRCVIGRPAAKTMVVGEVETSARNAKVVRRRARVERSRELVTGRVKAGGQGRIK